MSAAPATPAPLLRPMTAQDVEACAEMVAAAPLFSDYGLDAAAARRLLARALAEPAELTLAELEGAAAGFSWFVPRGAFDRSGYLRLIVIDPRAQGRGVGQALLGRLERRHGARGGIVLLAAAHNAAAHRFYERAGYRHVGTLPGYVRPGIDERIYYKACAGEEEQRG